MNRYVLDTNFIVSLLNDKDVNHQKAKEIAATIKDSYITIPFVVIAEIMSYSKNKKLRDVVLESTLEIMSEIFFLSDENIDEYIHFTYKLNRSFTAIDSIVLYCALNTESELITLDKKLKKLYKNAKSDSKVVKDK
jgi:predicted nucleic acid-binding protein